MARKKATAKGRKFLKAATSEPSVESLSDNRGVMDALQFYKAYIDEHATEKELSQWIVDFAEEFHKKDVKFAKRIDVKSFIQSHLTLMRLMVRGYQPVNGHADKIHEEFKKRVNELKAEKEETKEKKGPSPIEIFRANELEEARKVAGEIEGIIDELVLQETNANDAITDVQKILKNGVTGKLRVTPIREALIRHLNEFEQIDGDEELHEAYSHMPPYVLDRLLRFLRRALTELDKINETFKKARKKAVRKPKEVDPLKVTKNMKWKRGGYGVEPKDLVGSRGVILFNDKYNIVTYLRAEDTDGFSVKGSTIINYAETRSISKRLKSKIDKEAFIKELLAVKQNVSDTQKFFDEKTKEKAFGNSDVKITGRVNAETFILKLV